MRVTCPNCHRKSLLDAATLSDAPAHISCARCGSHFRVSILCEKVAPAADTTPAARAASQVFKDDSHAAPRLERDDAAALSADEPRDSLSKTGRGEAVSDPTCVVLELDGAGDALRSAETSAFRAEDRYRLGTRLLNLSPLRLLLAGFAFVVLVAFCDLLLASRALTDSDAAAVASVQNQSTNRSALTRRDASNRDVQARLAADEDKRATDDSAPDESADAKPAAVSDASAQRAGSLITADSVAPANPATTANPPATANPVADAQAAGNALEVSFASARQEIKPDLESATEQTPTARFTLQLAAYRTEAEAQELSQSLQAAGFEARIVTEQNSKRPWYCVQTRLFATRADAEGQLTGLRAKGFAASYTVREIK